MSVGYHAVNDQFTPKEERKLVRYLAKHSTLGSMGNKVFIRLCVNAEEKWGWSAAHDWKAWRALYREHQAYFDEQIRTRQDKLAEEQPRSREGADVDVRKRSSSSAVGAPYHDVVEGLHRDTIDWKDRWKEEEEEGSDECLAGTPQAPHVSVPRPRPDPYDRGNLEDEEEEDVVASDGHAISISLDAGVEPFARQAAGLQS
ncbi:hypothetical protein FPV67DRAFT_995344 [Lyophyllum atratum]|nr:hypothetical protein FPV67DRAFT_995344 [Lyophyllum atratum]